MRALAFATAVHDAMDLICASEVALGIGVAAPIREASGRGTESRTGEKMAWTKMGDQIYPPHDKM